jgi:hypothetical protein
MATYYFALGTASAKVIYDARSEEPKKRDVRPDVEDESGKTKFRKS